MRVLVVDDNPGHRKRLCMTLASGGHEAMGARDGVEALVRLEGGGFDAVVSDVLMPRMDGYRLCYEIRRSEELQSLRVIIYSATFVSKADERAALNAGADRFIRKLAVTQAILGALASVKGKSEAQRKPVRLLRYLSNLKEYSQGLVRKLEERHLELESTREGLAAANEALGQSEERFRRAFVVCPVASCLTDLETGLFLDVNEGLIKMLGYEREELLGHTSLELGIWAEVSDREQMVRDVAGALPVREREVHMRTKSGKILKVLDSAELLDVGKERVLLSAFHDITELRQGEAALHESEERYRTLFDLNPLPMWVFDPENFAFLAVNDSAVRDYGYSQDEFLTMTLKDLRPPEDVPKLLAADMGLPGRSHSGLRRHRKKDGTVIDVDIYSHEVVLGGRSLRLAILRDVSEQKRLEDQSRQAQRMEAVGNLASGIAHDFNNLLTPILGFSDILAKQIADPESRRAIVEVRKAAERAAAVTRQLLIFSRQQVLALEVLGLNEIVTDMEKMLQPVIGEDLELVALLESDLGNVKADRGQIEQVIMNLVVNSRDAMPAGGKLTLETRNVDLDESFVREHGEVRPGPYVMLAVSDTGVGMDDSTKPRIFEPFFTTKEPGKGTGLGLSTIYGIVAQSGGAISVYSEPGLGTTFKIYLPRVEEPLAPKARAVAGPEAGLDGNETVLVAEDDDAVRLLTRVALERHGYSVLAASGGAEALEMARQHAGPIDLLLTDMLMAGLTGPALALQMTALLPAIKVLFMSGYSQSVIAGSGDLPGKAVLLEKPFTAEVLARKIRQVLSQ
jgi:two-component system, cell cycle sensor histidine kinase and response regulator CckA